jgi:tripartite-type tricarboxylate transporter receptor subunit TctC
VLRAALKDPDFIRKEAGREHKKFIAAEIRKWAPVIKAAGVFAD